MCIINQSTNGFLKKIIKWCIPFGILEYRRYILAKKWKKEHPKETTIIDYFLGLDKNNQNEEIVEIIDYFEDNLFSVFPYEFTKKHHADKIIVYYDETCKMQYVLHENKRMYFPMAWDADLARAYYCGLLIEQDINSPHRYETAEFHVKVGDVIADIGAAEGIFALSNAEKAKKIYLFECNETWIKALTKTFEPWKEKVCIVNKYISDTTSKEYITLDDFLNGDTINFTMSTS